MSEDVRTGGPHVKVAPVVGDEGTIIWPSLMSPNKAKEMLMTGALLTADEAEDMGSTNHVMAPKELDERTGETVENLVTGPQTAIRYMKKTLKQLA